MKQKDGSGCETQLLSTKGRNPLTMAQAFNKAWGVVKSHPFPHPFPRLGRKSAVPTYPSDWERGNARLRFGLPMFTGAGGHPKRAYASSSGRSGWNYGEMPNPPRTVGWDEHQGDIAKLHEALVWRGLLQRLADRNEPTIARDSQGPSESQQGYYHGTECHCASCMGEGDY